MDCRLWASDSRLGAPEEGMPPQEHESLHWSIRDAAEAASQWLNHSAAIVREWGLLQAVTLPHPNGGGRTYSSGLVDPASVSLVVADAKFGMTNAFALYLGLVAQQPSGSWTGLSGFYLPWCHECETDGGSFVDTRMPELMRRLGASRLLLGDLPNGLAPRLGWFDRRFIVAWRLANSCFSPGEWNPVSVEIDRPCLVRVSASVTSASGIVYIDGPDDLSELMALVGVAEPVGWTWRAINYDEVGAIFQGQRVKSTIGTRVPRAARWLAVAGSVTASGHLKVYRESIDQHNFDARFGDSQQRRTFRFIADDHLVSLTLLRELASENNLPAVDAERPPALS